MNKISLKSVFDLEIFNNDEVFTKRLAWLWLLAYCDDFDGKLDFSLNYLAKKWNWNRSKVFRFLKKLENAEMIAKRGEERRICGF